MPLVKTAKKRPRMRVQVETDKYCGACIRCQVCGYHGTADVVKMSSRRNGRRSLERCPECKSLNIVCEEKSIVENMVYVQIRMFD